MQWMVHRLFKCGNHLPLSQRVKIIVFNTIHSSRFKYRKYISLVKAVNDLQLFPKAITHPPIKPSFTNKKFYKPILTIKKFHRITRQKTPNLVSCKVKYRQKALRSDAIDLGMPCSLNNMVNKHMCHTMRSVQTRERDKVHMFGESINSYKNHRASLRIWKPQWSPFKYPPNAL